MGEIDSSLPPNEMKAHEAIPPREDVEIVQYCIKYSNYDPNILEVQHKEGYP